MMDEIKRLTIFSPDSPEMRFHVSMNQEEYSEFERLVNEGMSLLEANNKMREKYPRKGLPENEDKES